jgi:aminopeptidase-like protein
MVDIMLIERYFDRLWPLNRSLTGDGNRESLKILSEVLPLAVHEVPSGSTCFDWTIPPEWNVKEAWIKDPAGRKIVDFSSNNLHLLGYSTPFAGRLSLEELKSHLYSLPEQPDLIPYLNSYYRERWGFCLTHNQLTSLRDGTYEVMIDSKLDPKGSMTYADLVLKGATDDEIFFSTYICHPSLAINELSGPLVTAFLYQKLKDKKLRYSYRFIFIPETIGSIWYLFQHGEHLKQHLKAGFVVTTIGHDGRFTYKRSRQKKARPDRAAELVLKQSNHAHIIESFSPPDGSDERQYCSPGFNLPVGSLMRTRYGTYPEYHTSADNKSLMNFEAMAQSIEMYYEIVMTIEENYVYRNQQPYCEPQLGKRGLYTTLGSQKSITKEIEATMWLLNLSDGEHDLIDIATESGVSYGLLVELVHKLRENSLLAVER